MTVETRRSFCRICIALCGIDVEVDGSRVLKVKGAADDPMSAGYTCPKGRALPDFHHHPDRLDRPMRRVDGELVAASWDETLTDLGVRLREVVADVGPDGIAVYLATGSAFDSAGRRLGERFLRATGSRSKYTSGSIDTPCKPMVAEMMGGFAGLNPTVDWERTTFTLLIGSNPVVSHGHISPFVDPVTRLRELNDRGEVWVVDPRRTESAHQATRHLAIRPGTDHVLLAHLVRELLVDGHDADYLDRYVDATDVETLRSAVAGFDLESTTRATGLNATEIVDLLDRIRDHGRIAALTGTGVTMSAGANCTEWLLWCLLIITGSYDQPRGMWFNPGYLRQLDTRDWIPADGDPEPGPTSRPELPRWIDEYPVAALFDEIESGNVRALIVAGGNPLTSFPDHERTAAALDRLDVLAVADVVDTDTTRRATHVLPCTGQFERADVPHFVDQFQPLISSRYTDPVVEPGADRRALWWVFAKLGAELGHDILPTGVDFDSSDHELIADLGARSRAGSFEKLRRAGIDAIADPAIVFGWVLDRLPEGRWRLTPETLVDQLEGLTTPSGLVVTPRRDVRHLNSQLLDVIDQETTIVVNPDDAADAGVGPGDEVVLTSSSGELRGPVVVSDAIRPGCVSVPHGVGDVNVGRLTSASRDVDPLTGMILQSGVAVTLRPAETSTSAP